MVITRLEAKPQFKLDLTGTGTGTALGNSRAYRLAWGLYLFGVLKLQRSHNEMVVIIIFY